MGPEESNNHNPRDAEIPKPDNFIERLSVRDLLDESRGPSLFGSFFLAGFECSNHLHRSGRRLSMLAATRHAELVDHDYALLRNAGIFACRDGIPWPEIERRPHSYDFSSLIRFAKCAEKHRLNIIWDMFHFGWPEDINPFEPELVNRFARFARCYAKVLKEESSGPHIITPVNEISFLSWAAGDVGVMYPWIRGRGFELKLQLVRASIAAMHEIRAVLPNALFMHSDPIIHVTSRTCVEAQQKADWYRPLQFQAWEMLRGDLWPEWGGSPDLLNFIGVDYYRNNQSFIEGGFIDGTDPRYVPLSTLLEEVWWRFRTPMLLSETGMEGDERPAWLRYVVAQVLRAIKAGCEIEGITWYPVVDYPGWEDGRHCPTGIWGYPDKSGHRAAFPPLLAEVRRLEQIISRVRSDRSQAACNTMTAGWAKEGKQWKSSSDRPKLSSQILLPTLQ